MWIRLNKIIKYILFGRDFLACHLLPLFLLTGKVCWGWVNDYHRQYTLISFDQVCFFIHRFIDYRKLHLDIYLLLLINTFHRCIQCFYLFVICFEQQEIFVMKKNLSRCCVHCLAVILKIRFVQQMAKWPCLTQRSVSVTHWIRVLLQEAAKKNFMRFLKGSKPKKKKRFLPSKY